MSQGFREVLAELLDIPCRQQDWEARVFTNEQDITLVSNAKEIGEPVAEAGT